LAASDSSLFWMRAKTKRRKKIIRKMNRKAEIQPTISGNCIDTI
jgi:hypothetical protein